MAFIIVCFVLGSNPLQIVIEVFFKDIWGSMNVDKIY